MLLKGENALGGCAPVRIVRPLAERVVDRMGLEEAVEAKRDSEDRSGIAPSFLLCEEEELREENALGVCGPVRDVRPLDEHVVDSVGREEREAERAASELIRNE